MLLYLLVQLFHWIPLLTLLLTTVCVHQLTRQKETHKRVEEELRREVEGVRKSEEETKRLNEEFKKKVRGSGEC